LTDQEGQRLQQIVRGGSTSSVRYRRAMTLLASAGGNRVPVIAQLVQADEDTVRDAMHRFNEIGLACLDPRWAGGRPRLLNRDDEDFVVQTAITRPTKLGQPFTHWSLRKLAAYLRKTHGRVIRIGREALRCLLARRGITFQRTKTWKESPDPDLDTKLDRIDEVLERFPDRVFAFDEFGPLGIRPTPRMPEPPDSCDAVVEALNENQAGPKARLGTQGAMTLTKVSLLPNCAPQSAGTTGLEMTDPPAEASVPVFSSSGATGTPAAISVCW